MALDQDILEFEEQLRLQNSHFTSEKKKTRVDPDGTVMEWDENRKAWFPQIDDDFIARYQMNYGATVDPSSSTNNSTGSVDWSSFNAQLAQLRAEKGEDSEEVQKLTKAANEALQTYYSSPAYREWYENYCKQQAAEKPVEIGSKLDFDKPKKLKSKRELKPSERMLDTFLAGGDDPELALARAEAEIHSGVAPVDFDASADVNKNEPESEVKSDSQDQPQETGDVSSRKRKQITPAPAWYEVDESKNTHVYVNGLPPTITDEEFVELMSKFGLIMNEPFSNKLRIKLYKDETGKPKGDGRCCYIKVESVELALKILDGMTYAPNYIIHVERAKFQPKGEFDPKKRRRLTLKEKKKLKEQQENLFRWGIDTSRFVRGKKERVVILKNVFSEVDFQENVTLIPVVRERIRIQCAKCGAVKKIVVHDAHPDGVVSITFSTPEEADTAVQFLDKALFDYPGPNGFRQLKAEKWDGKINYSSVQESKDKETNRIQNWREYLGGESSDNDDDDDDDDVDGDNNNNNDNKNSTGENNSPTKINTINTKLNVKKNKSISSDHKTETPIDYWEHLSEDSPTSVLDTDEENEDSGAETS